MIRTDRHISGVTAGPAMSWLALLAVATVGTAVVEHTQAEILVDRALEASVDTGYRLVVQSYSRDALNERGEVIAGRRPQASAQRAVTADQLARGVCVDMLNVGGRPQEPDSLIVAWLERGAPDLEFDGLEAGPSTALAYGSARAGKGPIVLRHPA